MSDWLFNLPVLWMGVVILGVILAGVLRRRRLTRKCSRQMRAGQGSAIGGRTRSSGEPT